jgi:hypothetical protein
MSAWLAPGAGNGLLLLLLVTVVIGGSILAARRGRRIDVRSLKPLEAIDGAVARSVAQGRPIYFVPGSRDLDNMQTVAALSVLGPVARKVADCGGRLFVPTSRSIVMETARDICRRAYEQADRADLWREDMVVYISDDQLGFVARVDGLIAREKPGVCFLMGFFASESLLLAEGGYQVGAVQIAGTASPVQLPFLVAACDHVLLGEELFAAGASLENDAAMLGSLRGQDDCKIAAAALIIVGSLLTTLAQLSGAPALAAARDLVLGLVGGG